MFLSFAKLIKTGNFEHKNMFPPKFSASIFIIYFLDSIMSFIPVLFSPSTSTSAKAGMQAIGAGALNQAVKAVAIARGFVAPAGVDLVCIPAFAEVEVEGEQTNRPEP